MQRVRMSLPYFKDFGWEAEVVVVEESYADIAKDELLLQSIPNYIKIHQVKSLSKKWTSKLGLGSIALRSIWFYKNQVNKILKKEKFDLIYFSTTQFPVLILGAYWKKKFNIPYVIDMQDPWHSDYYKNKQKNEKPPKYWFSYRLNKYLEPIAMKRVGGLISVSNDYLDTLVKRYPRLNELPKEVITFAAFKTDFDLAKQQKTPYQFKKDKINLVYIGRAGHDMKKAITLIFEGFKLGLKNDYSLFNKVHFYFIGTSYAPNGQGKSSVIPISNVLQIEPYVTEQTDRIPFYEGINLMLEANALLVVGSDDSQYSASKIYSYILAKKPFLAVFHPKSSAIQIIKDCSEGLVINLQTIDKKSVEITYQALKTLISNYKIKVEINWDNFEVYSAKNMTKKQCNLFNSVLDECS